MESRVIALIRISRPEREMRVIPLVPKRGSSVPSARIRMTAPRGVCAPVSSVPATSVVPPGPADDVRRADPAGLIRCPAGAETMPEPPQRTSSPPVESTRTVVNVAG